MLLVLLLFKILKTSYLTGQLACLGNCLSVLDYWYVHTQGMRTLLQKPSLHGRVYFFQTQLFKQR